MLSFGFSLSSLAFMLKRNDLRIFFYLLRFKWMILICLSRLTNYGAGGDDDVVITF